MKLKRPRWWGGSPDIEKWSASRPERLQAAKKKAEEEAAAEAARTPPEPVETEKERSQRLFCEEVWRDSMLKDRELQEANITRRQSGLTPYANYDEFAAAMRNIGHYQYWPK